MSDKPVRWSYSVDGDSQRNPLKTSLPDSAIDEIAEEAAIDYYDGCIDELSVFELVLYLDGVQIARRCIEVEKTYSFFVSESG